ncbi:hypothetical protein EVAR_54988_1 [Eumeta japonica]|uniref:Uncharacterized protein n=1 Tax=Eumeta variegata TaxID=151549 RepID=A0A4C1Z4X8_EUMVA|nr:hypothetical protein EVAR_54988_1 [Eumeta japonica]
MKEKWTTLITEWCPPDSKRNRVEHGIERCNTALRLIPRGAARPLPGSVAGGQFPVLRTRPSEFKRKDVKTHSNTEKKKPREDQRGMQGGCAMSPGCLKSDAALDSVEDLSYAELPGRRWPSTRHTTRLGL